MTKRQHTYQFIPTHATVNSADGFKDGNTIPNLNDYEYDDNDFRVKKIENLFCEESERSSMILDRNKGITEIKYNHLNLPTKITWSNTKCINYQYNAAGQKVSKTVRVDADSIKVVDYLDGFQYAGNQLQFFPTAEGYVRVNAAKLQSLRTYNYVYNHTDHLGNVRLSYSKNPQTGDLEILEENHYYPFGLKHGVYTAATLKDFRIDDMGTDAVPGGGMGEVALINVTKTEYQYKYNGKEYQDELGLNMYAMDFRNYDPALGRFHSMDAFASLAPSHTPYRFGFNNPVFWSDPSGLFESNGLAICPTCPQTPEFDDFINDPDIEYYYDSETKTVSEVEVFEETIMTGKKKNNANYSNSCIVGCHNIGRGFDRIGYSILRKTESEDFIPGGWGAGGGFTHNNKFYRPGIDKLVENDLLEWLSMLRGGFGSASSMSLQAYSDILALMNNNSDSQNNLEENEVITKIVDTVIIDKNKAIGYWFINNIPKDTVIKMPADTTYIKFKSWNNAFKQGKYKEQ